MLRVALGFASIPAGGLDMPGAREKSAEQIVLEMRRNGDLMPSRTRVWDGEEASVRNALGAGGVAGSDPPTPRPNGATDDREAGDVLDERRERELFPADSEEQAVRAREIRDLAARGLAIGRAMGAMNGRGADSGDSEQIVSALRGFYRTPWQEALQKWLEGVAPGERTFVRPSRRGADRYDVVLPGRRRDSFMLNVVLDTSASMESEIPRALGAIADFCDAAGVDDIRLIQCDIAVTSNEVVSPATLADFRVSGYGGSDLSPAMRELADDPRATAAIVITDGDIEYPAEAMPYAVLWALPAPGNPEFRPPYGRVITMQEGEGR
jgi:predicted metal-dependent peptidase